MEQERSDVIATNNQGRTQAPTTAGVAWACPACGKECWERGARFCGGCGVELPLEVLVAVPRSFWSRSAWHKIAVAWLAFSVILAVERILYSTNLTSAARGQSFLSALILCGLLGVSFVNRRRWIWFAVGALAIYPLMHILGKLPPI
jgi:hypothetical protein